MKFTFVALASMAFTAEALLTNPVGQGKTGTKAPITISKR
jgi:hypothetical protein